MAGRSSPCSSLLYTVSLTIEHWPDVNDEEGQ